MHFNIGTRVETHLLVGKQIYRQNPSAIKLMATSVLLRSYIVAGIGNSFRIINPHPMVIGSAI